jgi:hypothetical protein
MPKTTIKGKKGDWEFDHTPRAPGRDTIKITFKPKKDAKGCKNIRMSQTYTIEAFDAAGKKVTSKFEDMLKDPKKNPFGFRTDDEVTDKNGIPHVIDHIKCEGDPYYNGDDKPHDTKSNGDTVVPTPTDLSDLPGMPNPAGFGAVFKANIKKLVFTFETCAICVDTGAILGCVKWTCEVSAADGGNITPGTKEGDPSDAFKKALKQFVKNHTKKKAGVLRWYCPETGQTIPGTVPPVKVKGPGGSTSDPFGEPVPGDFQKKWVATMKLGANIKLDPEKAGTGKKVSMGKAFRRGLRDPQRSGVKFTWSGFQVKTVPSIVLTPFHAIGEDELASFSSLEPRLSNDFESLRVQYVSEDFFAGFLETLEGFGEPLSTDEGVATVTLMSDLGTRRAAAFTGMLRGEDILSLIPRVSEHPDVDDETLDLLTYICQNFVDTYLAEPPIELDPNLLIIEGIDEVLGENLAQSGVFDLEDLAEVDAESTKVPGIGSERLASFSSMARFLLRFPKMSGNDAEFVVQGLKLTDLDQAAGLGEISAAKIKRASNAVKLPADYNPEAVIEILRKSR